MDEQKRSIEFVLRTRRVVGGLVLLLLLLLAIHVGGLMLTFVFNINHLKGLIPLFSLCHETNVPTFFASFLLLFSSWLFFGLWCLGGTGRRLPNTSAAERRGNWLFLSGIFLFLAIDEFAMIHEMLINPVRAYLEVGGLFYFAWLIPYGLMVLVIGTLLLPHLWMQTPRFRRLFFLSAGVYLSGAIGLEMLGGRYYEAQKGRIDLTYRLYQTVEETLEFCGVLLLLYALLELIRSRVSSVRVQLHASNS